MSVTKKQAFEGLAKKYDSYRPGYPEALFLEIIRFLEIKPTMFDDRLKIIDVGCGTGISTRAFFQTLQGNCHITGIDPGRDMLSTAVESSVDGIKYIEASAESLPLESESVDIVTVGQAVQWFNRPVFYLEANRVLKENGVIAIFENNRDWENSDLLREHEEFLENYSIDKTNNKKYSRYYRDFPYEEELNNIFLDVELKTFSWERKMNVEQFLQMAKTSTQVKLAEINIGEQESDALILSYAKSYQESDGNLCVKYTTKLYMARKSC